MINLKIMSINICGLKNKTEAQRLVKDQDTDYTPLYNYIDNKKCISAKDGNIDVEGNKIINFKDPENNKDAVNKEYCNKKD